MIQYGLISQVDARCLEKTIDLILKDELNINITEVGIYGGDTGGGMYEYVQSMGGFPFITGIDNRKDDEPLRFNYDKLIIGNSNEVYNQIEDNSQHLIFEDSCHCFAHACSTFFCYAPKVKVGGYFAFHDTGKHIKPFKDFQHGDKNNPDAYISVRKALENIGLFGLDYSGMLKIFGLENDSVLKYVGVLLDNGDVHRLAYPRWKLIFDEADETNPAGGITVFKKLY